MRNSRFRKSLERGIRRSEKTGISTALNKNYNTFVQYVIPLELGPICPEISARDVLTADKICFSVRSCMKRVQCINQYVSASKDRPTSAKKTSLHEHACSYDDHALRKSENHLQTVREASYYVNSMAWSIILQFRRQDTILWQMLLREGGPFQDQSRSEGTYEWHWKSKLIKVDSPWAVLVPSTPPAAPVAMTNHAAATTTSIWILKSPEEPKKSSE